MSAQLAHYWELARVRVHASGEYCWTLPWPALFLGVLASEGVEVKRITLGSLRDPFEEFAFRQAGREFLVATPFQLFVGGPQITFEVALIAQGGALELLGVPHSPSSAPVLHSRKEVVRENKKRQALAVLSAPLPPKSEPELGGWTVPKGRR